VNFSADIVEVDGELRSKRGKKAGLKQLWTCSECDFRSVTLADVELASCPAGGELMEPLIKDQYADGRRLRAARSISEMRASVVESLGSVELD
jgi:nicotinate phosphoribosyltransferase